MSYADFESVRKKNYKYEKNEEDFFYSNNNAISKIIYHIDANSAFLSWEAVYRLQHGAVEDIREIPCVVGGDPKTRHGIVLAKSIKAKKYGIKTGESIMEAFAKCPTLKVVKPRFSVYSKSSNAMFKILSEYTPVIQRYSIDECFLDVSFNEKAQKDAYKLAVEIKNRIREELGFTVSVGISNNKLLAKMGSEIKKPDAATSLFPWEIKEKMWPMEVRELFMVGKATERKLKKIGINTIGELANSDKVALKALMKSHGELVWNYANGIDKSIVRKENYMTMKGMGNSTTVSFDVTNRKEAHMVLLSLVETTSMRLRESGNLCRNVSVSIRSSEFFNYSHRKMLESPTNCTKHIYEEAKEIFDRVWSGEPIRHLGIRFTELSSSNKRQISLVDYLDGEKQEKIDSTIDEIRIKYGNKAIVRAKFLHSGIKPINGGAGAESYPVMSSIL